MQFSRREILGLSGFGLGQLVVADLLGGDRLFGAKSSESEIPIFGDLRVSRARRGFLALALRCSG